MLSCGASCSCHYSQVLRLDLGDLESVRAFAAKFKAKYTRLDVLVNNGDHVVTNLSFTVVLPLA